MAIPTNLPKTARRRTDKREGWPPPKTKLIAMMKEAVVDAYTDSEQRTGFYAMLEEHLAIPFNTEVLGAAVTIERVDMTDDEQIVAICRRGRSRQSIPVLEIPVSKPRPAGAEWIEAYRLWAAGEW